MDKKHTASYLIGLSAISLALVFSITLSNNNSAIAQLSSATNKTTTTTATISPNIQQ